MKAKFVRTRDTITGDINRLLRVYKDLPLEAYDIWLKNTPKNTGNARNKTKLNGNEIVANYAYAERLDKGYSPKSRRGMSKPTFEHIQRYLKSKVI